jgi:hypothetical protein
MSESSTSRAQQRHKREDDRYGFGGEPGYSEQARRFYRKGAEVVKRQVEDTSVLPLLTGAAIAFAAGWIARGSLDASRGSVIGRSTYQRRDKGERFGKALIESDRVEGTAF